MVTECAKTQLKLFEPKEIQYSILQVEQVALKPLASIDKGTVIQFLDQVCWNEKKSSTLSSLLTV